MTSEKHQPKTKELHLLLEGKEMQDLFVSEVVSFFHKLLSQVRYIIESLLTGEITNIEITKALIAPDANILMKNK